MITATKRLMICFPRDIHSVHIKFNRSIGDLNKIKLMREIEIITTRCTYEKWTEHIERYEVRKCNVRPAALLVVFIAIRIAFDGRLRRTSHHYFLPRLAYGRKYKFDRLWFFFSVALRLPSTANYVIYSAIEYLNCQNFYWKNCVWVSAKRKLINQS